MQSNSIEVISPRTFVLRTKTGVTCPFTANVARSIPRFALAEALSQGVRPTDESEVPDEHQDNRPLVIDFQADLRRSIVYTAVSLIAEKNNPVDFDASNTPKVGLVAERVGFSVSPKELLDVYDRFKEAKANNAVFEVHPSAKLALTVIQATSLAELLLAAEELGENPKELKKIGSARDIRAKLMRKFTNMVGE